MRTVRSGFGMALALAAICGISGLVPIRAFGAGHDADDASPLPGSRLTVRDAVDRANFVAVVSIDRVGFGGEISNLKHHYGGSLARVKTVLKGKIKGELAFSFTLGSVDRHRVEEEPRTGEDYLFFAEIPQEAGGQARVIKMLHVSRETLRMVEGLLKDDPLPGSDQGTFEAALDADHVAMMRIIRLERGGPPRPEGSPFHAKVAITRKMKGGDVTGEFVYFPVRTAPNGTPEAPPAQGAECVFFIRHRPGEEMTAIKIASPGSDASRVVQYALESK